MRFNCGPSSYDKRRAKQKRLTGWHRWFAWFPLRTADEQCVWLEHVWRRGEYGCGYEGSAGYYWEYSVWNPLSDN